MARLNRAGHKRKRSKDLFNSYENCSFPSKMNPCTTVYKLVEDLVQYIK